MRPEPRGVLRICGERGHKRQGGVRGRGGRAQQPDDVRGQGASIGRGASGEALGDVGRQVNRESAGLRAYGHGPRVSQARCCTSSPYPPATRRHRRGNLSSRRRGVAVLCGRCYVFRVLDQERGLRERVRVCGCCFEAWLDLYRPGCDGSVTTAALPAARLELVDVAGDPPRVTSESVACSTVQLTIP